MRDIFRSLLVTCFILVAGTLVVFSQEHWEAILIPADPARYIMPDGSTPSTWIQPGFDDAAWIAGSGGVGYGDGDDLIVTDDSIVSVYIRQTFQVSDLSIISSLLIEADVDDGFVAYLNGTEVARYNLGTSGVQPAWDLWADVATEPKLANNQQPLRYDIASWAELLVQGDNVLAFEVHNAGITSSDLSSNIYLIGEVNSPEITYHEAPSWFVQPVNSFTSSLPIIHIYTSGQTITRDFRITARMGVTDNGLGELNQSNEEPNQYDGQISIKIRGESSAYFDKKSYTLETQTDSGTNNNVSLLGMPAENDWVLNGPYSDKSMLRNILLYSLSNEMGLYAPRTRLCELILNDQYDGVYVLTELIKQDKNRVDIAKLNPEDVEGDELTGGYIFRVDKTTDMSASEYWTSAVAPPYTGAWSNVFQYYDPGYEDLASAQRSYLRGWLNKVEVNLKDAAFDDPVDSYYQYLDVGSFVNSLIVSEFGKEVDSYRYSCYFNKDKDSNGGKIVAGPLWDRNLAFGNVDYGGTINQTMYWMYDDNDRVWWWRRLMEDPVFADRVYCRWDKLYAGLLSYEEVTAFMDSCINYMGDAVGRNYVRWPILGVYVWPNPYIGQTYEEEVAHLKQWIFSRLSYMDQQWGGRCENLAATDEFIAEPENLRVWPNPSGFEQLTFERKLTEPLEWISLEIYDVNGRLIHSRTLHELQPGTCQFTWQEGTDCAKGVYLYRWRESSGTVLTGKLIKTR
ncbi:MAG: CotH kinase family protein [Bacteroidota bacterium]